MQPGTTLLLTCSSDEAGPDPCITKCLRAHVVSTRTLPVCTSADVARDAWAVMVLMTVLTVVTVVTLVTVETVVTVVKLVTVETVVTVLSVVTVMTLPKDSPSPTDPHQRAPCVSTFLTFVNFHFWFLGGVDKMVSILRLVTKTVVAGTQGPCR